MTTLLAFDPAAETPISDTGWAVVQYEDDSPPELVASGVIHGGFQGFLEWVSDIPHYHNKQFEGPIYTPRGWFSDPTTHRCFPVDHVICEQWVDYGGYVDTSPRLIEGIIRYLWQDVVLQPSKALQMVTANDLKALGWYTTEGHHLDQNSAARHALYYLRSIRHKPTLRLLSE